MESKLLQKGFEIIENVYTKEEVNAILELLESKKMKVKFGIREFLVANPDIATKVFTEKLIKIIESISPNCDKAIKSIYFNKPPSANWIVSWHQDLTINLIAKKEILGYKNWRVTQERTVVQPNRAMLEHFYYKNSLR